MSPPTYMVQKIVQVAFLNIRKLHRLSLDNLTPENVHVPLAHFFHSSVAHTCQRGSIFPFQENASENGAAQKQLLTHLDGEGDLVADRASVRTGSSEMPAEHLTEADDRFRVGIAPRPVWYAAAVHHVKQLHTK